MHIIHVILFVIEGKGGNVRQHCKGCNCKRSGCLKNYCECYEVGFCIVYASEACMFEQCPQYYLLNEHLSIRFQVDHLWASNIPRFSLGFTAVKLAICGTRFLSYLIFSNFFIDRS